MLTMNNPEDINKMRNYYRTSDMLNLLMYFPEISPIKNLTIIEDEQDYLENIAYIETLDSNRVDSLKGRSVITGIETSGKKESFLEMLRKVKTKDSQGVLTLFNLDNVPSERYERYAGIAIGIDVGNCVYIDAVGKGFDGREVSKSICTHERYFIPWFELRKCCIENFKQYQTFQIDNKEYQKTRIDRIKFLESIGLNPQIFSSFIPGTYEPIPDFIWLSVIKELLKSLEKKEEFLLSDNFNHFAIHGHTEGKYFRPWQMFDKNRFQKVRKKVYYGTMI